MNLRFLSKIIGTVLCAAVKSAAAIHGIHCLYLISTAGILLLQVIYYRVQGKRGVCVHVKG